MKDHCRHHQYDYTEKIGTGICMCEAPIPLLKTIIRLLLTSFYVHTLLVLPAYTSRGPIHAIALMSLFILFIRVFTFPNA